LKIGKLEMERNSVKKDTIDKDKQVEAELDDKERIKEIKKKLQADLMMAELGLKEMKEDTRGILKKKKGTQTQSFGRKK